MVLSVVSGSITLLMNGGAVGNAYMELQFYGPGYVEQFEGFGCTAT